jgi:ATP-dependent protease HslVU (ClpYQ) peptidase subunit
MSPVIMGFAVLFLLWVTTALRPADVGATTIVVIWRPDRIVLAADSKLSSLTDPVLSRATCKIRSQGHIWYAAAGLYEASITGFNIVEIIRDTYVRSRNLDSVIAFAMMDLSREVADRLNAVRQHAAAAAHQLDRNLNFADIIMIAKEPNGLRGVQYQTDISELRESRNSRGVRSMNFGGSFTVLPTPPTSTQPQLLAVGSNNAITKYIRANPAWGAEDPVELGRRLIHGDRR